MKARMIIYVGAIAMMLLTMSCGPQQPAPIEEYEEEQAAILENKRQTLSIWLELGWADRLGHDMESFWAYDQADSLLNNLPEGNYPQAMSQLSQAQSYIFYGCAYQCGVLASTMGQMYPLDRPDMWGNEVPDFSSLSAIIIDSIVEHATMRDMVKYSTLAAYSIAYALYVIDVSNEGCINLERWALDDWDEMQRYGNRMNDMALATYMAVVNTCNYFRCMCVLTSINVSDFKHFDERSCMADDLDAMPLKKMSRGKLSAKEMQDIQVRCSQYELTMTQWLKEGMQEERPLGD